MTLRQWDVAWADLDPTAGHEQAGRRPVIVVSSQIHLRLFPGLVTVVPLTTKERPSLLYRVRVEVVGHPVSWAITEQVRTISRSRIGRHLYRLDATLSDGVAEALNRMVGK